MHVSSALLPSLFCTKPLSSSALHCRHRNIGFLRRGSCPAVQGQQNLCSPSSIPRCHRVIACAAQSSSYRSMDSKKSCSSGNNLQHCKTPHTRRGSRLNGSKTQGFVQLGRCPPRLQEPLPCGARLAWQVQGQQELMQLQEGPRLRSPKHTLVKPAQLQGPWPAGRGNLATLLPPRAYSVTSADFRAPGWLSKRKAATSERLVLRTHEPLSRDV